MVFVIRPPVSGAFLFFLDKPYVTKIAVGEKTAIHLCQSLNAQMQLSDERHKPRERTFRLPNSKTDPAARFCARPHIHIKRKFSLTVALCHTLQLVLLLDRIRVAAALGGVDQLLSQALSDGLDVAERGLAGTSGQEGDGLVDTAQRRNINGLPTDGSSAADTGAVFARAAVDNGVNGNLDGVLVGHEVDLKSS